MSKPPRTTPHSDIDGVHRDERSNTDVANARGEDARELERAGDLSTARPPYTDDEEKQDDRTR